MCLCIPMTHSKKNMKWLPKKIHVSSKCFCIFPPPFLSGFTALSEQEPGYPLLRNFQESPPAGQGAWAPRLVCLAPSPQRWSETPGSGCGSESVQGSRLWAGSGCPHWPLPGHSSRLPWHHPSPTEWLSMLFPDLVSSFCPKNVNISELLSHPNKLF